MTTGSASRSVLCTRTPATFGSSTRSRTSLRFSLTTGRLTWGSAFEATADPFAIESDVEIEVYSRELDKLLAMDIQTDNDNTEVEAQIIWHRAVCAEMGRARAILREGEYSDQED